MSATCTSSPHILYVIHSSDLEVGVVQLWQHAVEPKANKYTAVVVCWSLLVRQRSRFEAWRPPFSFISHAHMHPIIYCDTFLLIYHLSTSLSSTHLRPCAAVFFHHHRTLVSYPSCSCVSFGQSCGQGADTMGTRPHVMCVLVRRGPCGGGLHWRPAVL